MSEKFDWQNPLHPKYENDYWVFGPLGDRIKIRIQYLGPVPDVGLPLKPEVFLYEIHLYGDCIERSRVEWNPKNGPTSMQEVARALALTWGSHHPDAGSNKKI